jgi:hypothetical protein
MRRLCDLEKIVTGGKTNITCYECGIKGHHSNECPKKLNEAPQSIACPRSHGITEDRVKGRTSLTILSTTETPFQSNREYVYQHEDTKKGKPGINH